MKKKVLKRKTVTKKAKPAKTLHGRLPRGLKAAPPLDATLARYVKARPTEPDGSYEGGLSAPTVAVEVPKAMPAPMVQVAKTAERMAADVVALTISADNVEQARARLVQLKTYRTQLEDSRKALTKPLKDHVKRIEEMYRPTLNSLESTDTLLRQKLITFSNEAERAVAEAKAKLTAEAVQHAEAGDHEAAHALATQATTLEAAVVKGSTVGGAVGTATVLKFAITDYALIPREFFSLDEKKVLASIRAGRTDIPGIRVYEEKTLRVSTEKGEVQDTTFIEDAAPIDAHRLQG